MEHRSKRAIYCGELASQSSQNRRFEPILQIVPIRKSISYGESIRRGTTNPSSSAPKIVILGLASPADHGLIQYGRMPLFDMRREWAGLLFLLLEDFGFGHGAVGTVAWAFGIDSRTCH